MNFYIFKSQLSSNRLVKTFSIPISIKSNRTIDKIIHCSKTAKFLAFRASVVQIRTEISTYLQIKVYKRIERRTKPGKDDTTSELRNTEKHFWTLDVSQRIRRTIITIIRHHPIYP